jgi:serine/threonine protein kinase
VTNETNSARDRQIERFRVAAEELQLMEPSVLAPLIRRLSVEQELSPLKALFDSGLCEPRDIELVEIWLEGDSCLPGYEIVGLIGRGGMGVVWKARQTSLDRLVAVKMISATHETNKTLIARFEREASVVSKLSHPNIVTALDFGRFGNRLFLVMEYVDGVDLGKYVEQHGRLTETVALRITRQIASGLLHASRHGVIHRDIKPANILLDEKDDLDRLRDDAPLAKITDFGLALFNETHQTPKARLTSDQSTIGSPHYMAPDQLIGKGVDTRSDIYALGATLFHLLTGIAPWQGEPLGAILKDKLSGVFPTAGLEAVPISPSTRGLLQRMVAVHPDERPVSCQELLVEIDRALDSVVTNTTTIAERSKPPQAPLATAEIPIAAARESSAKEGRSLFSQKIVLLIGTIVIASLGILLAWYVLTRPSLEPIELVISGEPVYLFDGVEVPRKALSEGEIIASKGRLELGSSPASVLGFSMPQWDYFKFEGVVELANDAGVDVAIGGNIASKQQKCWTLRLKNGTAEGGSLTRIGGTFTSVGNSIPLDPKRKRVYLEIERNRGLWVVVLNGETDRQLVFPIEQDEEPPLEVVFAVHQSRSMELESDIAPVAISELMVSRLSPVR